MTDTRAQFRRVHPTRRRSFLPAHAMLIVFFTTVVTVSAGVLSFLQPSTYTSFARVVVEPRLLPNGGAPPPPDMATERAVATSSAVTAAAAEKLGLPARQAVAGLSVVVPVDTQVLEFRSSGPRPREVARRAQAFSQAYVDYSTYHSTSSRKLVPQAAEIITPATVPTSPSGPNHVLQIGAALLFGLALGIGIAAVYDRWDHRVRGAPHLAELTGAPVVAVIPRPRLSGLQRLVVLASPSSVAAEAYRFLQAKLLDPLAPDQVRTLVVTCATDSEISARDLVTANLAAAAAEAGASVALVPDSTDPVELDDLMGGGHPNLAISPGALDLSAAAPTGTPRHEMPARQPTTRLPRQPAGPAGRDERAPLAAPEQLRPKYDVVIVQGAPLTRSAGTLRRLRQCDAAVMVVDTELSSAADVQEAHHAATGLSGCPVATVLTYPCSARRAGVPADRRASRHVAVRTDSHPRSEGLA